MGTRLGIESVDSWARIRQKGGQAKIPRGWGELELKALGRVDNAKGGRDLIQRKDKMRGREKSLPRRGKLSVEKISAG